MANVTIPDLDPVVTPASTDLLEISQAGDSFKATSAQVVTGGVQGSGDNDTQVGPGATAGGDNGVAVGYKATAGQNAISIGYKANASAGFTLAIGSEAIASGTDDIALGDGANASGGASIAIGPGSVSSVTSSTAMGNASQATGEIATAIGSSAQATAANSTSVGSNAIAAGTRSTALGYFANASSNGDIAVGRNAQATAGDGTAIGVQANVSEYGGIAIGSLTQASGYQALAAGYGAHSTKTASIAIGVSSRAEAQNAIAIGTGANASFANSVAIGNVTVGAPNTLALPIAASNGDVLTKNANGWAAAAPSAGTNIALWNISEGVPAGNTFTWNNQGSATLTESSGKALTITGQGGTGSAYQLRTLRKTAPSTPYTLTVCLLGRCDSGSEGSVFVGFSDGTKHQILGYGYSSGTVVTTVVTNWSNNTTYASGIANSQVYTPNGGPYFLQISDDGTNVSFATSEDGVDFSVLYTIDKASGYLGSSGYTNVEWGIIDLNTASRPPIKATLRLWTTAARTFP